MYNVITGETLQCQKHNLKYIQENDPTTKVLNEGKYIWLLTFPLLQTVTGGFCNNILFIGYIVQ